MTTIERITRVEQVYDLPPGTEFSNGSSSDFYVTDEGSLVVKSGEPYDANTFVGWRADTHDSTSVLRQETFEEFRQRLCVIARGFQRAHGVAADPVNELLRRLDCWFEGEAEPGMWVHRSDRVMTPPSGHALVFGHHANWNQWGVFTHNWAPLFGGLTTAQMARVDGGPVMTPTPADAEQIVALKRRVWEAGVRAKGEQGWCNAFERAVGAMRIDRNILVTAPVTAPVTPAPETPGIPVGTTVNMDTQRAMPEGSIIAYEDPATRPHDWSWNVRVNDASWPTHTRQLFGTSGGSYTSSGQVVFDPASGPMSIPVTSVTLLNALPVGTRLTTNTGGCLFKWHDATWGRHEGHTSSSEHALATWTLHITHIPGVSGFEPTEGPAALF